MRLEDVIFSNLIENEDYAREVLPHLKTEYFQDYLDSKIFDLIDGYVQEYNRFPSKQVLYIELENTTGLNEEQFKQAKTLVKELPEASKDLEWLKDETEKFCQTKAIYNAIRTSIQIMDDKDGKLSKGAIPGLLTDALSVSFDHRIGHTYSDDAEARYEFYHRKEERLPFDIDILNTITGGGIPKKTLSVFLAGTNVGKTAIMCHMAAANYLQGKNVLYITLELAEERVAERIDANILDIPLDQMPEIPKDVFLRRINRVREKLTNHLIIKEYPPSSVNASNFRFLINELKIKKNFIPDVIYVDYLGIMASSRYKNVSNQNSYTIGKAVAEELRALAVEFNLPIISAVQSNREGQNNSDVDLTNTSESMGVPFAADLMLAVISTDELYELNQFLFKQLKNRFSDKGRNSRFVVGVDRSKMRLFNVENAMSGLTQEHTEPTQTNKFDRSKFEGFK